MKLTIATLALLIASPVAYAEELQFSVNAEYAVEAEDFSIMAKTSYQMDELELFATADFSLIGTEDLDFTGMGIGVGYDLSESANVYGIVDLDGDFEYSETTLGITVTF